MHSTAIYSSGGRSRAVCDITNLGARLVLKMSKLEKEKTSLHGVRAIHFNLGDSYNAHVLLGRGIRRQINDLPYVLATLAYPSSLRGNSSDKPSDKPSEKPSDKPSDKSSGKSSDIVNTHSPYAAHSQRQKMNTCSGDVKKKKFLMKQAIFFTPKKNTLNTSNEKKDIESKMLQNGSEDHVSNGNLSNISKWYSNNDQRQPEHYANLIWKGKDTESSLNGRVSLGSCVVNNNRMVNNPSNYVGENSAVVHSSCRLSGGLGDGEGYCLPIGRRSSGLANGMINPLGNHLKGETSIGSATGGTSTSATAACGSEPGNSRSSFGVSNLLANDQSGSVSVSVSGSSAIPGINLAHHGTSTPHQGVSSSHHGTSLSTLNLNTVSYLQKSSVMNTHVNIEGGLDYMAISSQYCREKKKDIVYLFQELLSYCECLKRSRKKSTEEINKIRISYNKVSHLLKETLRREKNSNMKIEELRNIIFNYDEKLDKVKNSSEGTITNLNENVQTLIDLNNNLEMEMNKILNENEQLRKIVRNEFQLNKEINDLRKQIEMLNNENISLVNEIDGLRLENSKIESEKNVLLSDKTLLHCKIDELENGLKNKNNLFNISHFSEKENNPFIINSDEEIKEQLNDYLNLNHDQRTELFKNFLYHWRETNKAGQKFYEQSYVVNSHGSLHEEETPILSGHHPL
ncbi:conserved Plasmodium protein, unknown function [Plasmodium ovale curtisi]|uniref:Uncharacterized protein n=1 Tax=Plasmodium ovale curtisi TaxID=864141 RepID=A0A1A8VLT1_PLAOA|nr:conserved Plasmodium protein, unknown function [Plasmodium ovale curtisi]